MNRNRQAVWTSLALGTAALAFGAYAATTSAPTPTVAKSDAIMIVSAGATTATANTGAVSAASMTPIVSVKATPKPPETGEIFSFGVQTHFFQGWNPAWLKLADQVGAKTLRDSLPWKTIETRPGVYAFTGTPTETLAGFCSSNGKLILTIEPKNPLYDGGRAVSSAAGQTAYANYVKAILDRFGGCIRAIEVGNEINNGDALNYPAGVDKAQTYVATLRTLKQIVKPAHPNVTILGGSTNVIGTGFLEKLFVAGALGAMDGVAVHPYRGDAEGVDGEIEHLRDVMRKYGEPVPIWATEFSFDTGNRAEAAEGLVKSAALLNAAGVSHASWYALVDQRWFPNMGLFAGTTIKPTGMAYATIMRKLFAYGRAVRVDAGDNLVNLFRFGSDRWLVWGAPRTITFTGSPIVSDIYGTARAGRTIKIGSEPVIIEQATGFTVADSDVAADTMLQYGSAPWTYLRRGTDNKEVVLPMFDNDYTSYYGDRWSKPLRINNTSGAPAGTGAKPVRAIIRYTAPKAQQLDLQACFSKDASGDGVDYRVAKNGATLASGILTKAATIDGLAIDVAAGDKIDLIFGPNQTFGGDVFRYRARLTRRGRATPFCS